MNLLGSVRRALFESYHDELGQLVRYFKTKPLDLGNFRYEFLSWDGSEAILERLGVDSFDPDSGDYELAYAIEGKLTDDEKESFAEFLVHEDAGEAPSWTQMDFRKVLKPGTWLLHKGNNYDILKNGFQLGEDDITKLALTTYRKKHGPGFNFAFPAFSGDYNEEKYGKHAFLFQSAAVLVDHYGDEEEQAIFWGPSVNPANIFSIDYDEYEDRPWKITTRRGNLLHGFETLDAAASWVVKNADTYRRSLGIGKAKARQGAGHV